MSSAVDTQVFGPYRVLAVSSGQSALLGRGAFGTVFHARHELTGQEVALKVIHDHLAANEQVRRRFRDEAREHRRLKHEGVVQILDAGETETTLYLAMEFCAGRDLQTWSTAHGPVTPFEALTLMRPIADALVYASGHGLIHRDIKPSNILLVSPPVPGILPTVKLADFGLAKKVWEDVGANGGVTLSASHSGGIKGTLQYASPEQVREEKIDNRSDMFALGLTLWHLLAGGYPFADQTTLQFIKERAELQSYESRFPSEWPPCLKDLMAKLVAGKAEDRYSTFGRVVGAIDYCLEELGEKAKPPPLPVHRPPALLPVREFFSLNWLEETPVGTLFDATPAIGSSTDGGVLKHQYLTLLRKDLAPSLREEIRQAVTRLAANPHPALAPVEWRETRDGSAVLIDVPPGSPLLLDVLRLEGPRRFSESLPWLEQIAGALDHAARLGLPGVETAPAAISVIPGGTALNRRLLLTAKLYRTSHDAQASASLTMLSLRPGEMDGGPQAPSAAFAFLAYRLLSSRDPKQAALSTPTAYVAIDALSETGNHYLREALCGHTAPSCLDLLALLCQTEAVTFHKPALSTLTFPALPPAPSPPLPSSHGYSTPLPFAPPALPPLPQAVPLFTAPIHPAAPTSLPSHSSAGLSMLKTVLDAAELEKKAALEIARQEREAALAQERLKAEQALALERQRAEAERRELAQRVDNERHRIIEEAKKQAEAERLQALEERRRAEEERMRAEAARLQAEARIQEERRQLAEQARLLEEKLAQHGQQLAAEREKNLMLEERNQLLAQEKNLLEQSQKQLLAAKSQIEEELSGLREREQHLTSQVEGLREHENSLLSQVESLSAAERKAAHDAEEHAHRAAEAEAAARNAVASGTIDAEAAQAAATQAQRDREQSLREVARLQAEREKAEAQREEIARQAEAHQSLLAQTTADLHSKDEELRSKNAELQLKSAELEEKASQIALLLASKQEAEAQASLQVAAREKAEAAQQAALELAKQAEAERQAAEQKLRELTAAREKAEAERRASEELAARERLLAEERARQLEAELRAKVEAERLATEQKVNELALMREKAEADRRALEELALKERELAEQRAREQETILRAKAEAERAAAEQKLRELAEAREKAEAERLAAEKLAAKQREETEKRLREKEAELRAKAEAERLAIEKKLQQEAKAREKAEQERRLAEKRAKEAAAGVPPRKTKLAWATIGVLALGAAGAAVYYATRTPGTVQVVPPTYETRTFIVKGSAGLPQLDEETAQRFNIVKGPLPNGSGYEIGLQSVSSTTFPSEATIGLVDLAGRFVVKPDQEGAEFSAPPSVILTIHRADSPWGREEAPVTLRLRTNRDQKDYQVPADEGTSTWSLRLPESSCELSWFGPAPGTTSTLEIPLLNTTLTAKAHSPGDAPTTLTLTLPALPQSTFLITGENTFQYVDEDSKSTHTAVTPTLFIGGFNYFTAGGGKSRAHVELAALTPNSLLALPSASFFRQWAVSQPSLQEPEQDVARNIAAQLSQLQHTYEAEGRTASIQAVVNFIDGSYQFWNHWSVEGNGRSLFLREALRTDPRFYLAWSTDWMLTTGPLKSELSQHYKTQRLAAKLEASGLLSSAFSREVLSQLNESPSNDFWALAGPNDGGLRGAQANGALEFQINPSGLDFTLLISPSGNDATTSWKTPEYQLQAGSQEFTPFPIVRNMSVRLEPTSLHLLTADGQSRPAATPSN